MKSKIHLLALAAGMLWMGGASATLWDVFSVHGCSGSFCASVFHASSGSSPMSGDILADITDVDFSSAASNTYDDASGAFDAGFTLENASGNTSARLTGTLSFDVGTPQQAGTGLMDAVSSLTVAFDVTPLYAGTDDDLFFDVGYQCCDFSGFDPNSFLVSGSPFPVGGMLMTIWGANGWNGAGWPNSSLGIDLRIFLVEALPPQTSAPEPATLALVVLGIAGLSLKRRRKVLAA